MSTDISTTSRWSSLFRTVWRVLLPATAVLVLGAGIAYTTDVPVSDLLRDPSAVIDGPWYIGVFSTTGIALWAVAGAVSLLALAARPEGVVRRLLIAGGVVSFLLGADDGYLLHETIKNDIGIPSPVTIGVYGVLAVILFAPALRYLLSRSDSVVFLLALGLLAVSVILDFFGEAGWPTPPGSAIIEDMAKFLGIVTWATYHIGLAASVIRDPGVGARPTGRHVD